MGINDYFGYVGDLAFCIGGVAAAKELGLHPSVQLLSGISTAFFGGIFLRDLGLLRTAPAIFGSPWEIAVTAVIGIITVFILSRCKGSKKLNAILSNLLCTMDSIGISAFAVFGYGRGIQAGVLTAFLCGFVTACGGGIIASVIRAAVAKNKKHLIKTLAANKFYYLFGAVMSAGYGIMYALGIDGNRTVIIMAVTAIIIGFLVSNQKSK